MPSLNAIPSINRETLRSPAFVLVAYVVLAALSVLFFRTAFPAEPPPLPVFRGGWRAALWLIDIVALFPALVLSALVLPFCMDGFRFTDSFPKFSPNLFKRCFMVPVITAISASVFYALLFFLVLPAAQNSERNMRSRGEIYRMASERALAHYRAGEWVKASQFLGIAGNAWGLTVGAWPDGHELADMTAEVNIHLERMRFVTAEDRARERSGPTVFDIPGLWNPVNTAEAMDKSRAAYADGRLFDAHWLATLGQRLAPQNSPEWADAARFAAHAWNLIEDLSPTPEQARMHELFARKRSGYRAMLAGDWIQAFHVFRELSGLLPGDPDVRNFLEQSTRQLAGVAFFTDEMYLTVGNTVTGPVFSLPVEIGEWRGRAVLRLAGLSFTPDAAFGVGLEYMLFDRQSRLLLHLHAPYARFRPFTVDADGPYPRHYVMVLMRALDRDDPAGRWEHTVESVSDAAGVEAVFSREGAWLWLNVDYETFLMLARMRRDVSAMSLGALFDAATVSAEMGYIPQVFEAEILNRLGGGLFLLPLAVAAIAAGWRFRTRRFPRYVFIPLLFVLPVVFNGVVHVVRAGLNVVGISLTLAVGFSAAFFLFWLIMAALFVCSLFLLAAQKS